MKVAAQYCCRHNGVLEPEVDMPGKPGPSSPVQPGITFVSPRPNGVFIFKRPHPSNCNVLRQKGRSTLSFNIEESHLQAHVLSRPSKFDVIVN